MTRIKEGQNTRHVKCRFCNYKLLLVRSGESKDRNRNKEQTWAKMEEHILDFHFDEMPKSYRIAFASGDEQARGLT